MRLWGLTSRKSLRTTTLVNVWHIAEQITQLIIDDQNCCLNFCWSKLSNYVLFWRFLEFTFRNLADACSMSHLSVSVSPDLVLQQVLYDIISAVVINPATFWLEASRAPCMFPALKQQTNDFCVLTSTLNLYYNTNSGLWLLLVTSDAEKRERMGTMPK